MSFAAVEQLKAQYTDRLVEVDPSVPELRRFKGLVGTVKTVNMNGRLLIQFDHPVDIGWYDIDPAYLRIVEGKAKKTAAPKPAEKPAAAPPATAAPVLTAAKSEPAKAAAPSAQIPSGLSALSGLQVHHGCGLPAPGRHREPHPPAVLQPQQHPHVQQCRGCGHPLPCRLGGQADRGV